MFPGKTEQFLKFAVDHDIPVMVIRSRRNQLYCDYMAFRRMGFRAVTAYGIAKYGFSFLLDMVIDSERTIQW